MSQSTVQVGNAVYLKKKERIGGTYQSYVRQKKTHLCYKCVLIKLLGHMKVHLMYHHRPQRNDVMKKLLFQCCSTSIKIYYFYCINSMCTIASNWQLAEVGEMYQRNSVYVTLYHQDKSADLCNSTRDIRSKFLQSQAYISHKAGASCNNPRIDQMEH